MEIECCSFNWKHQTSTFVPHPDIEILENNN